MANPNQNQENIFKQSPEFYKELEQNSPNKKNTKAKRGKNQQNHKISKQKGKNNSDEWVLREDSNKISQKKIAQNQTNELNNMLSLLGFDFANKESDQKLAGQ